MRSKLRDYAARYVSRVGGSDGYARQFEWLVNAIEKTIGRQVYVDEITTDFINELLKQWKPRLSTVTIRSRRNMLFRLARVASRDERLDDRPPKPLRDDLDIVKRRHRAPLAWSADEVAKLVMVARSRPGYFRVSTVPLAGVKLDIGAPWVRRSDYWESYILAAWDTGLRSCDLTRIRRDSINDAGRFSIVQAKTNKPIAGQFRQLTIEAIQRTFSLTPDRELIWPIWLTRGAWFRCRYRLIKRAGLSGGMGRLRHSAGTAAELVQPGSGCIFLGNSPEVFFRHYFDRRHLANIPQPPELPSIEPTPATITKTSGGKKPWEKRGS